jgi:hypothetical protein
MTNITRSNPVTNPRLAGLLTATVAVFVAIACWLVLADGSAEYQPLISGACTTIVAFWTLFVIRRIRRRQAS